MNPVGQLRPSQLVFTFGVGALTDLPALSVLVMGLDEWDVRRCHEVAEDRLLSAVRGSLGMQVEALRHPPVDWDADGMQPSQPGLGVPVAAFPRWLRCPVCGTLATVDSGVFKLQEDQYRPERTCFVHAACRQAEKAPQAHPVRFLRACRNGHLSDLPWFDFTHYENPCPKGGGGLQLYETGTADEPADLLVRCTACDSKRPLSDAFARDRYSPPCAGFHPHLRRRDAQPCPETEVRTLVLGASNTWFPIIFSVLALPRAEDKLGRLVEERWADLKEITSLEVARFALSPKRDPAFAEWPIEKVWAAIETKRAAESGEQPPPTDAADLKGPEWRVFTDPASAPVGRDFRLREVAPPDGFSAFFERTVLAERLREVRALVGFNRIESRGDFTEADAAVDNRRSPLSRGPEKWVPATEVRGEGLFLRFREEAVQAWLTRQPVIHRSSSFFAGHRQWRTLRRITPPDAAFPGMRYVLVHSFAHALLRQLALECGYSAASLRERIYCREAGDGVDAMAGVLLYTAASDSEGTLGGLVSLGEPVTLGRLIRGTLAAMSLCGSDPLCAEHEPALDPKTIHGACCHSCLFASETSCERGNRYLDRAVLVPTFKAPAIAFFTASTGS